MASGKWTDESFGKRLREERDKKQWTQPQMAEMLGIDPTTLAKIEKGRRSVRIVEAVAMADLLGVSLDRLLGRRAGLANELADVVSQLKHVAGRAVIEIVGLQNNIGGLFQELGGVDFDGRSTLEEAGGLAMTALSEAQSALFAISTVDPPGRVVQSHIDELIQREVNKRLRERMPSVEEILALLTEEGSDDEAKS